MSTSGTYTFNPSLGELGLYAFNLCQLRSTSLTQEHLSSLRQAANFLLANWSNRGVNLWQVDLQTVTLVEGQATYDVDANTVVILDAYVTITEGTSEPQDRIILPISRSEYASYSNKTQQGFPTTYWFDRLLSPTVTLWQVPDGNSPQTLSYYRLRQAQDANFANGQNVEIPYLWLEAFADGLAWRLSRLWAPQLAEQLKADAAESYAIAATQNEEVASIYISPQVNSYYRV